ncbi:MAG: hypothetical protein K0B11_13205 [Mariniphaga sp.]|nr:hypothetical protein [Mariniphaga sp.]
MKTFDEKRMTMTDTFPGAKITTDFESGKIEITTASCTKSFPIEGMSLKDYEQLILKTELENKPVSELTVKEFNVLNFLTFAEN